VQLCEQGVHPEALATVVKEIRRISQQRTVQNGSQ